MSYIRKYEYKLLPDKSYEVIRNCSGCGKKTNYINTGCFRVNANGNLVDIWLIYQCKTCKHTWNMTIYERVNKRSVSKMEFEGFAENSKKLAFAYGTNRDNFVRNRAEIDWNSISYTIEADNVYVREGVSAIQNGDMIIIHNESHIKVRGERLLSELLNISRTKVKKLLIYKNFILRMQEGKILIECNKMPDLH